MRVLVVGDLGSQFVVNFVCYLKKYYSDITLDLLDVNSTLSIEQIQLAYGNTYTTLFKYNAIAPFLRKIPIVRGVCRIAKSYLVKHRVAQNHYDVVCVHGFFKTQLEIASWIRQVTSFTVGVFWGSDLFKRELNNTSTKIAQVLPNFDRISLATQKMREELLSEYNYPVAQLRSCLFGLKPLEFLNDLTLTKGRAKQNLGIKRDDFVITCGYNGSTHQQHKAIINSLIEIKSSLPDQYVVVLPVTYGGTEGYINELVSLLDDGNLRYKLIKDFLTDEEVAYLRKGTDLFIQIQKTDAYSGSMQENLYCGNVTITGSWLPYQHLVEMGIYLEQIGDTTELPNKLVEVLSDWTNRSSKATTSNTPDKFSSSLWSVCIHDWYAMLNEHCHQIKP